MCKMLCLVICLVSGDGLGQPSWLTAASEGQVYTSVTTVHMHHYCSPLAAKYTHNTYVPYYSGGSP